MGPEIIMVAASMASTAIGAFGQTSAAKSSASSMEAQAAAGVQAAQIEAQWAKRRQDEEMAAAQQNAADRLKEARLAQSKLIANAAVGGGNASDPTVMDLWKDIEGAGFTNAGREEAEGQRKAAGIKYQADMGLWRADANQQMARYSARQARSGATLTMIGGLLGAVGQGMERYYNTRTRARYPSDRSGATGYG